MARHGCDLDDYSVTRRDQHELRPDQHPLVPARRGSQPTGTPAMMCMAIVAIVVARQLFAALPRPLIAIAVITVVIGIAAVAV